MAAPEQGQALTPQQKEILKNTADHWRQVGNEATVEALAHVEDAARQLIGLNAGLQGLYLAIFAFSDLRQQVEAIHLFLPGGFILLLFFLPILLWLISLYCATRVFVPQVRPGANLNEVSASAWRDIRKTYRQTVDTKLSWLHRSHRWLVGSFAVVLVLLVCLAFLPPAPAPGPTQIIIITPTPVVAPTAKP